METSSTVNSTVSSLDINNLRCCVLEGGGVCCVAHCGALKHMENLGMIKRLTHFTGSSAGSILAAMLACKMTAAEIETEMLNMDFTKFEQRPSVPLFGYIYNFLSKYGLYSSEPIEEELKNIFKKYSINPHITFKQLKDLYGTTLIVTATLVGKGTVYYSYHDNPDFQIVKAVKESCTIPCFYTAIKKEGALFVDGGLIDNYPIRHMYNYLRPEEVIGLKLITTHDNCSRSNSMPTNVYEFTKSIIQLLRDQSFRLHVHSDDWKRTIPIDVEDVSAIDFDLPIEKKMFLIHQGEKAGKKFFQ